MVLQHALLTPTNASHGHVFLRGHHKLFFWQHFWWSQLFTEVLLLSQKLGITEIGACSSVSPAWGVISASPGSGTDPGVSLLIWPLSPNTASHPHPLLCVTGKHSKSNHCGNISWVIAVIKHTPTALDDEIVNWNVSGVLKRSQKAGNNIINLSCKFPLEIGGEQLSRLQLLSLLHLERF